MTGNSFELNDDNAIIQGLWIGSELSTMERLSISSFLANGHRYHLYVYSDVRNVPAQTVLRDAAEILPASSIFQYQEHESYAGFADYFRYELLLKRGGWWVDLDAVCLRRFLFEDPYVIGSEPLCAGGAHPNNAFLKARPGSDLMAYLSHICRTKDSATLQWGETGPRLVAEAVKRFSLEVFVQAYPVFCPYGYYDCGLAFEPGAAVALSEQTHAVHLWNEIWRRRQIDKDAHYRPDCLYEQLKARYLR